ncbi:hypothetical protein [Limnohabitans sp.]|uniref:helix-turn-helix transcriptional regulator n=1 Tax=Limnohabitans sp. TaxID=1907725 RepID=UPI0033419639
MSEIDRLYQYKTLLSGRRAMSREDIMQILEISLATFKRDLAKLRDQLHTPIVFDRDLGGYLLEQSDSTELPGLWFSQDEMLALMTIQSMIEQLEPGLLGPKLKPFQKRLDDMLASQGLDTATLTQRVRAVHAGKRRLTLTSFETVVLRSMPVMRAISRWGVLRSSSVMTVARWLGFKTFTPWPSFEEGQNMRPAHRCRRCRR